MKPLFRFFAALVLTACSLTAQPAFDPRNNLLIGGTNNQVKSGAVFTFKTGSSLILESGVTLSGAQATDATLTAIAGQTTAANKLTYWDGVDDANTIDFSTLAQTFVGYTTASQWRNAIFPATPAEGDLAWYNGTDWVRLAVGSTGEVLTAQADGTIDWGTAASGAASTVSFDNTDSGLAATDVQEAIDEVVAMLPQGDVVGPASATDNALARFDSTTGKLIQNSTTTLSDAGAFSFADGVRQTFNPDGTNAGLNVGSHAGDPSSPSNGDLWYDSASNELTARINGSNVALGAGGGGGSGLFVGRTAKTGAYTIVAGDQGYLIDCTSGTFSLSFTAAATLGNGFFVAVYNSGSGTITLDPNGSETIRDGTSSATTKTLAQGQGMILVCDGSGFLAIAQTSSGAGGTGTVTFSANTITGTTSGNTVLTTSVGNADVQLTPNGTGYVAAATRFVIDGTAAQNHVYVRNTAGGAVTIAFDGSGSSRGTCVSARIQTEDDGGFGGHITFSNKSASGNNTTTVERMRLTSGSSGGGNLLIGTTSTTGLTGAGGLSVASTTTSTTTATGSAIFAGGVGIAGPLYAQQPVVARTTALSVAANQTRALFTNEGTTSQVVFTLPSAAAAIEYTFVVQDTDGLRITAASGDTIRIAGTVSGAAGYVESTTIGNTITVVAINATEWVATAVNGTWTFSP